MSQLSRYRKFLVVLPLVLAAFLKVVSDALGDGTVSTQEWIAAVGAAFTAFGVYAVRNVTPEDEPHDPTISEAEFPPNP